MTTRITKKIKLAAKGLATAYQAYVEALNQEEGEDRDRGLSVWGKILVDRQRELGVEMLETEGLLTVVDAAGTRQAARRIAA